MTTTHALELLLKIMNKWEEGPGPSGLEVIPVLVENLSECRLLIEAVVRLAGGAFLDAREYGKGEGARTSMSKVPTPIDANLRLVATRAFDIPQAGGGRLKLGISERNGRTRVTINGIDAVTASAGLSTIGGVAASLFSSELSESTLAVITYDESELDADLAQAVWDLFTRQLAGMAVGRVHTLVLLVEATGVIYERHCAPGSSLAYRLHPHGLERRKPWNADLADIREIGPQGDRPVVLFLGAGFSASSGLPLGNEVRDTALRRMFPDEASRPLPQLMDQFRSYIAAHDRWMVPSESQISRGEFATSLTLERVLREELFRYGRTSSPTLLGLADLNTKALAKPGRAVDALRRLTSRQRNLVIVTVNFDQLAEVDTDARVFTSDDEFAACASYLEHYFLNGGSTPVLKLHGTIERPETIVATVDQTMSGMPAAKMEALQALIELRPPVPWIYIGYSMRDPDLESVLALPSIYEKIDERWVSPFTVATAQQFTEQHRVYGGKLNFWQRSITETADVFCESLVKSWDV